MAGVLSTASAQFIMGDCSENIRYGVQLGFNMPTLAETQYSTTIGYNFGVTAVLDAEDFIPNSYVRGSLLYSRKGSNAGTEILDSKYQFTDVNFKMHYTELPVRFGYAFDLGNDFGLLLETGPYFGLRWTSSLRADKVEYLHPDQANGNVPSKNCDMKDYYRKLRRFDAGWGLHFGAIFLQKYQLMLGYDWGLCDAVPEITGGNRNLSLNLTVYIDR